MIKSLKKSCFAISVITAVILSNPALAEADRSDVKARLMFRSWNDETKLSDEEKAVLKIVKLQVAGDLADVIGSMPVSPVEVYFSSYDLDEKGEKEVFVCYKSTIYCRYEGKCPLNLYQFRNKQWEMIHHFSSLCQVGVANEKTNGFDDLVINKSIKSGDIWEWVPTLFKWKNNSYVVVK